MTPLPAPLGNGELVAWRLDETRHASAWDSGEGAFQVGGRWNNKGVRAVYCALDPGTAILEIAAHKTFDTLDRVPHTLTCLVINDPTAVHIVHPTDVPNANWLVPGIPSRAQKNFGDKLLRSHKFIVIPSAVTKHSWNLIFDPDVAAGAYTIKLQEPFALDTRLNP